MTKKDKERYVEEKINIPSRKTYQEVFDHSTLMVLYGLMTDGFIDTVEHPISTGKEAKVFKGLQVDGTKVALKIMRINTAVFRKYRTYIEGDPRFKDFGGGRNLIFTWTKKEFSNLKKMHKGGLRVPEPITFSKNVLVMEYLGYEDNPAPMLKDVPFDEESLKIIYDDIVSDYKTLYQSLGFVHGDLSEYNVLISNDYPYLIDVSQSVPLAHPKSQDLLERDVKNIVRYFSDHGIQTDEEKLIKEIKGVND
ncbi:MAG: serine protein kinase RIO [Candidatus Saliniplasma sp.]